MAINFRPLGVDDETSGYIGVVTCIVAAVISISVSFATDRVRKHMKTTILMLLVLQSMSFIWLTLLCAKVIPFR